MQQQQQQPALHGMSAAAHVAVKTEPGTAGADSSSGLPATSDTGRAAPAANASAAAAAGCGPGVFQLPEWTPGTLLASVEPGLYGLLDAFCLPDELAEQLADALEELGRGGQGEGQQQQQHVERLARFQADYAQVRRAQLQECFCWRCFVTAKLAAQVVLQQVAHDIHLAPWLLHCS
jgi:hypothetical protein